MVTTTPPVLTPMRSPMPPRRAPPLGVGGAWGAGEAAKTAAVAVAVAGSSSEKETPTVVFTENSPHSNVRGSGIAFDRRSTMAGGRRLVVSSSARPEKLFQSRDDDDSDDDGSSDSSSGGDDDDGSRASDSKSKSTRCDGDDVSSDDSEVARHHQVVSMIQNILDCGIASVCRLRGLFPQRFYQTMDFHDGTSVTKFNEGAIRRMCTGEGDGEGEGGGEDEDGSHRSDDEGSDDGASSGGMVRSFRERTQKSLSPLTELSQRCNDVRGDRRRDRDRAANGDEEEKRLAKEALLLLRWMQRGGVNEILRDGNLARLVFGICVPSEGSSSLDGGANNDELVESYSFDISYERPTNPGQVEENEVKEAVGIVFQNLNGFQAGRSLSQSVVPSKTQTSFLSLSQSTRAPFPGGGTQSSSLDLCPRSQMMEMSQKSIMESMSQSIRLSVKKNRRRTIPNTRYLALRVEFTNSVSPNELPPSLKQNRLETSPTSIIGGNAGEPLTGASEHHTNRFVVTPLGRIAESGYSGLCVDMVARTKVDGKENDEDDHKRIHSTQRSRSSYSPDGDDLPLTQPVKNDVDIENEYDVDECQPLTQKQEKQGGLHARLEPLRKSSTDCIEDCIKNERADTAGKDIEVQVGSKALGQPYGLKGGTEYVLCDVLDHRITKSCADGKEKEEFKCAFYSTELRTLGKKKQWLPLRRLVSYNCMAEKVQGALGRIVMKTRGASVSCLIEEVAQKMNVNLDFVQEIAKKRKTIIHVNNKRIKRLKA